MNQRQIILVLIAVVVFGLTVWLMFDDDTAQTKTTAVGGTVFTDNLKTAQDKFIKNRAILLQGASINKRYEQFAAGLEDTRTPGMDPGMAASNQLYEVLTKKLGVRTPNMSVSKAVPIKTVDDFYFINISFKVNGSEREMKRLLQDMEQLGFLIQSFKMSAANHGQGDMVEMEVVVSRLVKHDAESLKRMKGSSGRGGRGSISR